MSGNIVLYKRPEKAGYVLDRGLALEQGEEHEMNFGQFILKNWVVSFSGNIDNFNSVDFGLNYKAHRL